MGLRDVDDLDTHYASAKAAGAGIVEEPHPFPATSPTSPPTSRGTLGSSPRPEQRSADDPY
jgi:hypothetical protein